MHLSTATLVPRLCPHAGRPWVPPSLYPQGHGDGAGEEVRVSLPVGGTWSSKLAGSGMPLATRRGLCSQWRTPWHSDGFKGSPDQRGRERRDRSSENTTRAGLARKSCRARPRHLRCPTSLPLNMQALTPMGLKCHQRKKAPRPTSREVSRAAHPSLRIPLPSPAFMLENPVPAVRSTEPSLKIALLVVI